MDGRFETNADPELVDLFRAESDAHVPVLSQGLLALEKGQADDQTIASMMRAAHSIKGAARIVGIDAAVRVAHLMEDCFTAAGEKRSLLTSDAVDVLLGGVDALQRICALQPDAEMTEAWLEAILSRLATVKEGRPRSGTAVQTPAIPRFVEATPIASQANAAPEPQVVLPREFDDAAAAELLAPLQDAIGHGASTIRIDFSSVRQISAQALSLLVYLAREAGRIDPSPTLLALGVSGPLSALLRVCGLDRAMTIEKTNGA